MSVSGEVVPKKVVFIDDEESLCFAYKNHLRTAGYQVEVAGDYHTALGLISSFGPELIVADIILGGRTGIDLLREVRKMGLTCPMIMITGEPNVETAMEAVKLGAYDYLPKPFRKEKLLTVIANALREKEVAEEKERYRQNLDAVFGSIRDGIVTVDDKLQIIESNKAFRDMCGLAKAQLQGREFGGLVGQCSRACLEAVKQTLATGEPVVDMQVECRHDKFCSRVVQLSTSPLQLEDREHAGVVLVVRDVTRIKGLEKELQERFSFHSIIGKSSKMQDVYKLLEVLADTDTTVLIGGESGTGKELVARALHHQGNRQKGPLITVDCSTLTESILESELFGHVKGAFTGADKEKIGRFQLAEGGTLFLDEIGNISSRIQQKILRFLQGKEIERVGDPKPVKLDVRIIAATNSDLKMMVEEGQFRQDLYYRLKVMEVKLPPLRERREDIPLLVDHFLRGFNRKMGREVQGVSPDVLNLLMSYSWPGNVRELEHAIEHGFILCRGNLLTVDLLPSELRAVEEARPARTVAVSEDDEKARLLETLLETDWNKAKTARKLGLSRRTIYRQMIRYEIVPPGEE